MQTLHFARSFGLTTLLITRSFLLSRRNRQNLPLSLAASGPDVEMPLGVVLWLHQSPDSARTGQPDHGRIQVRSAVRSASPLSGSSQTNISWHSPAIP